MVCVCAGRSPIPPGAPEAATAPAPAAIAAAAGAAAAAAGAAAGTGAAAAAGAAAGTAAAAAAGAAAGTAAAAATGAAAGAAAAAAGAAAGAAAAEVVGGAAVDVGRATAEVEGAADDEVEGADASALGKKGVPLLLPRGGYVGGASHAPLASAGGAAGGDAPEAAWKSARYIWGTTWAASTTSINTARAKSSISAVTTPGPGPHHKLSSCLLVSRTEHPICIRAPDPNSKSRSHGLWWHFFLFAARLALSRSVFHK